MSFCSVAVSCFHATYRRPLPFDDLGAERGGLSLGLLQGLPLQCCCERASRSEWALARRCDAHGNHRDQIDHGEVPFDWTAPTTENV